MGCVLWMEQDQWTQSLETENLLLQSLKASPKSSEPWKESSPQTFCLEVQSSSSIYTAFALQFIFIVATNWCEFVWLHSYIYRNVKIPAGELFNCGWLSPGGFLRSYWFELLSSSDPALGNLLCKYWFVTFWQIFQLAVSTYNQWCLLVIWKW